MEKVEQFIQVNTKTSSNNIIIKGRECTFVEYKPWLTPDQARKVAEIAREETIKEVCEWLNKNSDEYQYKAPYNYFDMGQCTEDLKKHFSDK